MHGDLPQWDAPTLASKSLLASQKLSSHTKRRSHSTVGICNKHFQLGFSLTACVPGKLDFLGASTYIFEMFVSLSWLHGRDLVSGKAVAQLRPQAPAASTPTCGAASLSVWARRAWRWWSMAYATFSSWTAATFAPSSRRNAW